MRSNIEKPVQTIVREDHSIIIPPASLREKVMSIGVGPKDSFDMAALERAEAALALLVSDFESWMRDEADRLESARETFHAAPGNEDNQQILYRAAHDIRGQGRTFGYPLAAEIADGLCDLIEGADNLEGQVLELIDAHIDTIRAVVRDRVRDENDTTARSVMKELKSAREAIIGVDRFVKITAEVY